MTALFFNDCGRQSARKTFLAAALLILLVLISPQRLCAATRVAILNFACDDVSQRSEVAMVNLTIALQSEVSSLKGFEWVERVEIEKLEAEREAFLFGKPDRAEELRNARWCGADWAISGRIGSNTVSGRTVVLQIVDLNRASLLAETNLLLRLETESASFSVTKSGMAQIAATVEGLLGEAGEFVRHTSALPAVALLYFRDSSFQNEAHDMEANLSRSLSSASIAQGRYNLLRSVRQDAAADEADMSLAVLTAGSDSTLGRVADKYVWGTHDTIERWSRMPGLAAMRKTTIRQARFEVWDGHKQPRALTISVTNESEEVAAEIFAAKLAPELLVKASLGNEEEGSRRIVSSNLITHALLLAKDVGDPISVASHRAEWESAMESLDAACFFDPSNLEARELRLRLKWNPKIAESSRSAFLFLKQAAVFWDRHVRQHGFASVISKKHSGWWNDDGVESGYILSILELNNVFQYVNIQVSEYGVPSDLGGIEIYRWKKWAAEELFRRIRKAPNGFRTASHPFRLLEILFEQPGGRFLVDNRNLRHQELLSLWPHVLAAKRGIVGSFDGSLGQRFAEHFESMGLAGQEKKLIEEFDQLGRIAGSQAPPKPVVLPTLPAPQSSRRK